MQLGRTIRKLRRENNGRKPKERTVNDTGEKKEKEQSKKRAKAKRRMAYFS